MSKAYGTGKRKTSIARVWLQSGNGKIIINDQTLDEWLGGHEAIKKRLTQPLDASKQLKSVDIKATVIGGGYSAQADAVRHGISRALVAYDPNFRKIIKPLGLLTRDSRIVERKKPGKRKARRSRQFSKR